MIDFGYSIYLLTYIIGIIYLVVLGCVMLFSRPQAIYTRGEFEIKQRMTRSVGAFLMVSAFECLIYLPFMLAGFDNFHWVYGFCFLVTLMLNTSMVFVVMRVLAQKKMDLLRPALAFAFPYLLLIVWYALIPKDGDHLLPLYLGGALCVISIIIIMASHVSGYRDYVRRMRSEYSETSCRNILWSWHCFGGFALQCIIFVIYQWNWSQTLETIYTVLTFFNVTYLCYCTYHQKPLDIDVVEEEPSESETEKKSEDKAFYAIIEQRLESLCEGNLLFLEPDLTRESLCLRLNIGRTYLGMYFRSRGLTFYQYINTLRVEYAIKLMQKNPEMPIREVSELSGFRSQTTFRKVFKEVMGCLPSDIRNGKLESN
ncbi:MAG: AraC family transcriptional regulator [Bacteroidales bacterium]|nr:AraC family transcriptional regulator [Candidatus Cryptobacteroides equifaecalis]